MNHANQQESLSHESGPKPQNDESTRTLDHQWLNGLRIAQIVHSRAYTRYSQRQRWVGALAAVASALAAVAASFPPEQVARSWIAALTAVAALVTGVVTALNYGGLAERHRTFAAAYGDMRRELEDEPTDRARRTALRKRWSEVDAGAPARPQDLENRVRSTLLPDQT
jgi:hypothetical protein